MDKDPYDYNTIDLGGYDTNYDVTYDTTDIMKDIGTITISGGGASGTSSITTGSYILGSNGTTGYTIATPNPYGNISWANASSTNSSSIHVNGDAEFEGDIKVKGKSINEWMETMEKRLAILVPDPKKLEKFEALQKAYKHYKMLEALCEIEDEKPEN